MTATFDRRDDVITSLSPGGDPGLAALSDDELLANTRRLVGKSNQLLAVLLVHLAEVEVRGAHRTRRCASLYTYCIYELRFSEDEAARRSAAARLVKQFPPLFRAIADGELHLTGLLMIGPHLTPENHVEVLERLRNPTWEQYVSARAPQVRELPEGERPRDWANDDASPAEALLPEPLSNEALPVGPAPRDLPPVTGPQHYQLQFSTTEEHAQLVDRAKALLARSRPGMSLGELHLEAMRLLVASLERRRFDAAEPRYRPPSGAERPGRAADQRGEADPAQGQRGESEPAPRQRSESERAQRQRGESDGTASEAEDKQMSTRSRSRYIPAAVRREVFQRDGGRCSYVDARGERCCEVHYLELHHLQPFAKGGAHFASNLTLRCAAHNALAAEEDFGADVIASHREARRHEAIRLQRP